MAKMISESSQSPVAAEMAVATSIIRMIGLLNCPRNSKNGEALFCA